MGLGKKILNNLEGIVITTVSGVGFYYFGDYLLDTATSVSMGFAAVGATCSFLGFRARTARKENPDLFTLEEKVDDGLATTTASALATLGILYWRSEEVTETYLMVKNIINQGLPGLTKEEYLKNIIGNTTKISTMVYLTYGWLRLVGKMFNPKYLVHNLMMFKADSEKDPRKKRRIYSYTCENVFDSADARHFLSNIQINQGDYEEALINSTKALALPKVDLGNFLGAKELLLANPRAREKKKFLEIYKDKVEYGIAFATRYVHWGNIEKAASILEETEERFPDDANLKLFYYTFLKEFGDEEKARQKLTEAVAIFEVDPIRKSLRIKSKYAGHLYMLKLNERKKLEEEMKRNSVLKEILDNRFKVANPEGIIIYRDGHVYVMTHEQGITLAEIDRNQFYHHKQSAELTGIIQGTFEPGKPRNYYERLKQRILNCEVFDEKTKKTLIEIFGKIEEQRQPIALAIVRDAHANNDLIHYPYEDAKKEESVTIALDLEPQGTDDVVIDMVKSTESSSYFTENKGREETLARHRESFNHNNRFGQRISSLQQFVLEHTRAIPMVAVSYYCFSYRQEDSENMRTNFMQNAIASIPRLKETFQLEYRRLHDDYKRLEKTLRKLAA